MDSSVSVTINYLSIHFNRQNDCIILFIGQIPFPTDIINHELTCVIATDVGDHGTCIKTFNNITARDGCRWNKTIINIKFRT